MTSANSTAVGDVLAILGPTAVGKTAVALHVAQRLNADIISVDSRQVYRELDIGTAKPTAEEQRLAAHHLIDVRDPSETFSAAAFQSLADEAIRDIGGRGLRALLVGGSGLYYRALVEGLFEGPSADAETRSRLESRARESGDEALHRELASVDPEAAQRIHRNDRMRVVRALEVHELTGRPISQLHRQWSDGPPRYSVRAVGLRRPRERLNRRANARIKSMLEAGLLEEVAQLRAKYDAACPAFRGFGYAELWAYLDGKQTHDKALELLRRNTHRFAKRQMTWFRADRAVEWLDVADDECPERTSDRVVERWLGGRWSAEQAG